MKTSFTRALLISSVLVLLGGLMSVGSAQICAGSSLRYVVRDTHGVVINPSRAYQPDRGDRGVEISELKDAAKVIKGTTKEPTRVIQWFGMCNFKKPVDVTLNLDGKAMRLIFHMPKFTEYESRNFLVDSIPFRQGTFAIDLSSGAEENPAGPRVGQFYAAKGWKKLGIPKNMPTPAP